MKTCTTCGVEKPLTEFYVLKVGHSGRINPGRFPECKDCSRARARVWQRTRRASDPTYTRRMFLRQKYGITPEGYDAMLAAQGGHCAICPATEPGGKGGYFHVDHDHACCPGDRTCGRCVRGLLCHGCNTGLGSLGDDVDRLMAAAAYLLARQNVLGPVTF